MTARCAHYPDCGGCTLQHLPSEEQVALKEAAVLAALAAAGVRPDRRLAPLVMEHPWAYRRKARLGVRVVQPGAAALVGFRRRGGHALADLAGCEVLVPQLAKLIPPLRLLAATLEVGAEIPQIEAAAGDDGAILSLRVMRPPSPADRARLAAFAGDQGVGVWLQEAGPAGAYPLPGSAECLHYGLDGLRYRFGPHDFIQVNGEMNARMVAQALELLAPGSEDRVLDLFCGLGNFSLPAARRGPEVVGLEGSAGTVARAAENAARNGIANVRFGQANLYRTSVTLPADGAGFTQAILDPPRSGAQEVLPQLPRLGVGRLLYVSCYPATLARDAAILAALGYRVAALGILDMFPHTEHVEAMALFERG